VTSSWFFFSTHMQRCTDKHTSNDYLKGICGYKRLIWKWSLKYAVGGCDWFRLDLNRDDWRAVVNATVKLLSSVKSFLTVWGTVRVSWRTVWRSLPVSYVFRHFVISYLLCVAPPVTQTAYEFIVICEMNLWSVWHLDLYV